jgi:lipid-A-disaccharide synthase
MRVLCVSIEASGDRLLASILRTLKKVHKEPIELLGVGGVKSQAEGLSSIINPHLLAAHGFTEALGVLFATIKVYLQLKRLATDVNLCIFVDAPEINMRLLKWMKSHTTSSIRETKIIYVAPPQAWAWRPKRVSTIALADEVICLFKFEKEWMKSKGVNTQYVGHPLASKRSFSLANSTQIYPTLNRPLVIAFFPGSRASSVRHTLLLGLLSIAYFAQQKSREVIIRIASTDWVSASLYESAFERFDQTLHTLGWGEIEFDQLSHRKWHHHDLDISLTCVMISTIKMSEGDHPSTSLFHEHPHPALSGAHLSLCHAGTSTLESAIAHVPLLTIAPLSRLSAFIAKLMINVQHCALPNLCLGRRAFPEVHMEDCTAIVIGDQIILMIDHLHSYSDALKELNLKIKPWSISHLEDLLKDQLVEKDSLTS